MRVSESAFSVSAFILARSFDSWLGKEKKKKDKKQSQWGVYVHFLVLHKTLFVLTRVKQVVNKGGEGMIVEMRALNAALLFFLPRIIGLFFCFFFFLLHTHVLKPTLIQSFTSFFFNYFPFLQCDTHPFLYVDRIEKWKLGDQDKEGTEEKRKKYCQRSRRQLISTWYTTPLLQFFFFFFWLWLLFFFFSLKGKTRSFPPFVSGTRCVELTGPLPAWKQSRWLSAL